MTRSSQNLHQRRSKMPQNSAGGYYEDGLQDSHASRMTYLPLIHPLVGTISLVAPFGARKLKLTRELPTLRPRGPEGSAGSVDFKTLRPNSIPGWGLDLSAGRGGTPASLRGRGEPLPHTTIAGTGTGGRRVFPHPRCGPPGRGVLARLAVGDQAWADPIGRPSTWLPQCRVVR